MDSYLVSIPREESEEENEAWQKQTAGALFRILFHDASETWQPPLVTYYAGISGGKCRNPFHSCTILIQ